MSKKFGGLKIKWPDPLKGVKVVLGLAAVIVTGLVILKVMD